MNCFHKRKVVNVNMLGTRGIPCSIMYADYAKGKFKLSVSYLVGIFTSWRIDVISIFFSLMFF